MSAWDWRDAGVVPEEGFEPSPWQKHDRDELERLREDLEVLADCIAYEEPEGEC